MENHLILRELEKTYKLLVLDEIKPLTDYQVYIAKAEQENHGRVVIAFGNLSGQYLERRDVCLIKICDKKFYVPSQSVYSIKPPHSRNMSTPRDHLVCIDRECNVIHHSKLAWTINENYQLKTECHTLSDDYYDEDTYAHYTQTQWCEGINSYIWDEDARVCESDEWWYHVDQVAEILTYSEELSYYVNPDDSNVVYAEDIEEYIMERDAHWDSSLERHVFNDDNISSRNPAMAIQEYHCGVTPTFYTNSYSIRLIKDNPLINYTIGFEVEKTEVNGNHSRGGRIRQQPLFSHWETDSSCGVEGITNVYSLDNEVMFLKHVEQSPYVNEPVDSSCGGHINFAHRFNKMQYWHIRPWLGLIFAMWKKRLQNQYSSQNKKVSPYRGHDYHYGVLVDKNRNSSENHRFELRLPNRVRTSKNLINRFHLMQSFVECIDLYIHEDFSYMNVKYDDDKNAGIPNWIEDYSHQYVDVISDLLVDISPQTRQRVRFFIEKAKDVLIDSYEPTSLRNIVAYAYAFQSYIDEENPSSLVMSTIADFVNS